MADSNSLDQFIHKFRVEELLISRNEAWTWSVRPAQPTIGSAVLSLNRYALRLSDVTADEMALLSDAVVRIESAVSNVFKNDIMNYLALMMVDHHVHYHVVPRYEGSREFASKVWVDNGWPALPVMSDSQHSDDPGMVTKIRDALRGAI